MQTHNFENLLQVETTAIAMLRAAKDSVSIAHLQERLPNIKEVGEMLSQLAFLEKSDLSFKATTNQIFSESSDTSTCFVLLTLPREEGTTGVDQIGSLKWYLTSMVALKYHITFMSAEESTDSVTLKYRSNSYSAFLSLK